jgi:deoxyribonuclease-4
MPRPSARSAAAAPPGTPCLGVHVSVAGGLAQAWAAASRLRLGCLQLFVKNQRQWQAPPLSDAAVAEWRAAPRPRGCGPVVAHASYLVNLASADRALWERSRAALADELVRCDRLEIPYLVVHPGAAGERPVVWALWRVAAALDRIHARHPDLRTTVLLETTAGQGTSLGRRFEELRDILAAVRDPRRIGVCVDTCHVFAAGYDLRTDDGYEALVASAAACVGLERVRCWHLNDSVGDLGSRRDRHAHIGHGAIGAAGFRRLLHDPRFAGVPLILETPKGTDERGRDWDVLNLQRLRRWGRGRPLASAAAGR